MRIGKKQQTLETAIAQGCQLDIFHRGDGRYQFSNRVCGDTIGKLDIVFKYKKPLVLPNTTFPHPQMTGKAGYFPLRQMVSLSLQGKRIARTIRVLKNFAARNLWPRRIQSQDQCWQAKPLHESDVLLSSSC